MTYSKYPNSEYVHHKNGRVLDNIREVVFGVQDGMVSTLGALTGIAVGSGEMFIVLLAGISIISVESISMGIGAYTSSRSEKKLIERMLHEEKEEIHSYPAHEKEELKDLLMSDGWSERLAIPMAEEASHNKELMLREMAYRELRIFPDRVENPAKNGFFMFGSYIVGGSIPLSAYFFLEVNTALMVSIGVTLAGLFLLGTGVGKYTKELWYKTGLHMLAFGGAALVVGYAVGILSHNLPF